MEREISTKLVGVTKENDYGYDIQDILEQINLDYIRGDEIILEHELDNEQDKNAIKAYYDWDHIGYIEKGLAKDLAPLVDQGKVEAELSEITGGKHGKYYGCNILLKISDWGFPRSFQAASQIPDTESESGRDHTYPPAYKVETVSKRPAAHPPESLEPTLFDILFPPDSIREKLLMIFSGIASFSLTIYILAKLFA